MATKVKAAMAAAAAPDWMEFGEQKLRAKIYPASYGQFKSILLATGGSLGAPQVRARLWQLGHGDVKAIKPFVMRLFDSLRAGAKVTLNGNGTVSSYVPLNGDFESLMGATPSLRALEYWPTVPAMDGGKAKQPVVAAAVKVDSSTSTPTQADAMQAMVAMMSQLTAAVQALQAGAGKVGRKTRKVA